MRKSFLSKLLTGILLILFFTFIIQAFLQKRVLPTYFQNQVMENIEAEIINLPRSTTPEESADILENFTISTHTSSTLVNLKDYQEGLKTIPYITIESTNGKTFKINVPKIPKILEGTTGNVSGEFYKSVNGEFYVPINLFVNNRLVYGSQTRMGMSTQYSTDIVDTDTVIELSGTFLNSSVTTIATTEDFLLNRELLNITTGNTTDFLIMDKGVRYISEDIEGNKLNLVYITQVRVGSVEKILLTIYPLSNISYIAAQLNSFNLVVFGLAFIFIIITFGVFTQRISIPLKRIIEATRKFSKFEFSTIPEVKSNDEIGHLSRNINILSTNLQSTLSDLKDKNQALSSSLELESTREKLRKDFVEGISHELKTPLAVIQATNEALSLGLFSEDEIFEHHEIVKREITKTNKIISDMMSVYKVDQADYMINWKDNLLGTIIYDSIDSHKILAEAKAIQMKVNISPSTVFVDYDKILLVINNLLGNAIKYSKEHSTIEINSSNGSFEIINEGSITTEELESVFEPFFRVDKARARQDGSTGLGLYIVKQILTQHKAEFGAKSNNDKVIFYFQFKRWFKLNHLFIFSTKTLRI